MTGITPQITPGQLPIPAMEDGELRLSLTGFGPHPIHQVPTYFFAMIDRANGAEAGNINLRLGWDDNLTLYAGHIGYGVHEAFRGYRFAARSVLLLRALARLHGFCHLWITCDPDNIASRRACERAGAAWVETIAVPGNSVYYARGIREKCRYRLSL